MRLSSTERSVIREVVARYVADGEVYLFGSRADDSKRGGDIDLLILSATPVTLRDLRAMRIHLKDQLGDQKLDLVAELRDSLTPFGRIVRAEGIRLC